MFQWKTMQWGTVRWSTVRWSTVRWGTERWGAAGRVWGRTVGFITVGALAVVAGIWALGPWDTSGSAPWATSENGQRDEQRAEPDGHALEPYRRSCGGEIPTEFEDPLTALRTAAAQLWLRALRCPEERAMMSCDMWWLAEHTDPVMIMMHPDTLGPPDEPGWLGEWRDLDSLVLIHQWAFAAAVHWARIDGDTGASAAFRPTPASQWSEQEWAQIIDDRSSPQWREVTEALSIACGP